MSTASDTVAVAPWCSRRKMKTRACWIPKREDTVAVRKADDNDSKDNNKKKSNNNVIIYFHGGGGCIGSIYNTHDCCFESICI